MFALDQDTEASEACAQGLMNVLGIEYASEGKKATVFGKQCRALGLIIDLSVLGSGQVILKHTPERVNELHRTITKILDADHLSPMEAETFVEDYIGFRLSYSEGDPRRPSGKLADERQAMTAFASWTNP